MLKEGKAKLEWDEKEDFGLQKIRHTEDIKSLDRCGLKHQYRGDVQIYVQSIRQGH